MPSRRKEFQ